MKVVCSLAAVAVALSLTACSTTQQVEKCAEAAPSAEAPSEPVRQISRPKRSMRPNMSIHAMFDVMLNPDNYAKQPEKKQQKAAEQPSEEQQKAAEALLAEAGDTPETPAAPAVSQSPLPESPAISQSPLPESPDATYMPTGGLRMGSIVPQEDPASVGEADPPAANSVELRGLRSPKMPSDLPMDIDGKLKSEQ